MIRVPVIAAVLGAAACLAGAAGGLAQGIGDTWGNAPPPAPPAAAPAAIAPPPPSAPEPWTRAEPDWTAAPTVSTLQLQSGFEPDPRNLELQAGGGDDAASLGGACTGRINGRAPDVVLDYRNGGFPLGIFARSAADTVLVVHAPDGRWRCNDDSQGLNPAVAFPRPPSGRYAIWVGTVGAGRAPATLAVTELPIPLRWPANPGRDRLGAN
ncbi:MAG TPA: hypothetical protein VGM87_12165 [Roseomonas sp.]|jgi:serine protease Do